MKAKNVLYAAVGAPIVAARKVSDQVGTWKAKLDEEAAGYGEAAEKALNGWAAEGEKIVSRLSQGAVVEEISSKVDLDQAKQQVSKLRDQLEDMLATWRTSFRPEEAADAPGSAEKPATASGAAEKPATAKKATTAKKPATAKKTTTESTATSSKTSSEAS